ncbi:MAG: SIMPL domain-containing protein, partial [Nitrososphaeraceae archaeon]
NLDNVSQWIDTAVASGANSINSIDFSVTEKRLEDTRSKLITDAISNAKQKAEAAASAVQLSITGVKSIIVDGATTIPPFPPQPFAKDFAVAQGGTVSTSTPIIAGEQEVTVSVSCIFSMG